MKKRTPVSYTHLDVYKRQQERTVTRGAAIRDVLILVALAQDLHDLAVVLGEVVLLAAVSYTHLWQSSACRSSHTCQSER